MELHGRRHDEMLSRIDSMKHALVEIVATISEQPDLLKQPVGPDGLLQGASKQKVVDLTGTFVQSLSELRTLFELARIGAETPVSLLERDIQTLEGRLSKQDEAIAEHRKFVQTWKGKIDAKLGEV
eukprot:Colp12_sorted_trinity150504_noHs@35013